ncbi:MAG: carboxy terminal-processing peptidase [Bacteroidales bacterium]|nr:carboxy terminal-processing peptidase [Bacteroidales bacterium]
MLTRKPSGMDELGSLKMTVQKFYRINGGATQIKGVSPDIVLPDYYSFMDFGEKDLDYAMNWDKISKLPYNEWQPSFDAKYITDIAVERIIQDTTFNLIEENGERLKGIREDTEVQLNYNEYKVMISDRKKEGKVYNRIGKDTLGLIVNALSVDLKEMESDTAKQARNKAWLTDLKKDVYLFEAANIMEDIQSYRKSNARKDH